MTRILREIHGQVHELAGARGGTSISTARRVSRMASSEAQEAKRIPDPQGKRRSDIKGAQSGVQLMRCQRGLQPGPLEIALHAFRNTCGAF